MSGTELDSRLSVERKYTTIALVGAAVACGCFYFDDHYTLIALALAAMALGAWAARLSVWRFLAASGAFFLWPAVREQFGIGKVLYGVVLYDQILCPVLVAGAFALMLWPDLRATIRMPKRSRVLWWAPVIGVLSAAAMCVWFHYHMRGYEAAMRHQYPGWQLGVGIVFTAFFTALTEEIIFRGALFSTLRQAFDMRAAAVLQAVAFGLWHWEGGLPNGALGSAMAFAYGLTLGLLRGATGSIWPPVAAHTITGIAIGSYVVWGH
jgi:membrane protease YdiL (CAAX protease family)